MLLAVRLVLRQRVLVDLKVIFATFLTKLQCFFSVSAVNFTEVSGTEVLCIAVLGTRSFLVQDGLASCDFWGRRMAR